MRRLATLGNSSGESKWGANEMAEATETSCRVAAVARKVVTPSGTSAQGPQQSSNVDPLLGSGSDAAGFATGAPSTQWPSPDSSATCPSSSKHSTSLPSPAVKLPNEVSRSNSKLAIRGTRRIRAKA